MPSSRPPVLSIPKDTYPPFLNPRCTVISRHFEPVPPHVINIGTIREFVRASWCADRLSLYREKERRYYYLAWTPREKVVPNVIVLTTSTEMLGNKHCAVVKIHLHDGLPQSHQGFACPFGLDLQPAALVSGQFGCTRRASYCRKCGPS